MTGRDRSKFARDNANWLVPAFGAVMLFGILRGNEWAVGAGAVGIVWVAVAAWKRR